MKSSVKFASILAFGVFALISTVHAQYEDYENQAIRRLETALRMLRNEIQNGPGGQDSRQANLYPTVVSMESYAADIRRLARGPGRRNNEQLIANEIQFIRQNGITLVSAIPTIHQASAQLLENIFDVSEAIGALKLAFEIERERTPQGPRHRVPRPQYGSGAFCSVSYNAPAGPYYAQAGASDLKTASDALAGVCTGTNREACLNALSQASCVDGYLETEKLDPAYSRYTSCSVGFHNINRHWLSAEGSGKNLVLALIDLWDKCGTLDGRGNGALCRHHVATNRFSCSVR